MAGGGGGRGEGKQLGAGENVMDEEEQRALDGGGRAAAGGCWREGGREETNAKERLRSKKRSEGDGGRALEWREEQAAGKRWRKKMSKRSEACK